MICQNKLIFRLFGYVDRKDILTILHMSTENDMLTIFDMSTAENDMSTILDMSTEMICRQEMIC